MKPSAQPFLWKWVLFAWEWKILSIPKAEHLTSFWHRGPGNSEMAYSLFQCRFRSRQIWLVRSIFSSRFQIWYLEDEYSRASEKIYICELHVSTPFEFLVCIKYWSSGMLSTTRPPFLPCFLSCVVCFGLFWLWLFFVGFTFAPLDCKLAVGFSDLYYAGFILYVTFVLPIFTQMIARQQQQPHQRLGIYWWVMVDCS